MHHVATRCYSELFILSYFNKVCSLPPHKEIELGESVTREVNQAVKHVLSQVNELPKKKQKVYTAFK